MTDYANLAELAEDVKEGHVNVVAFIDNDDVSFLTVNDDGEVTDDYEDVYSVHPQNLLEECLDLLGILHEHV